MEVGLEGVIKMTSPGKTSSGSWMCGFRSTIYGSPHLSLMVWRVSPSPTTYISSQGWLWSCFPLTGSELSLIELNNMRATRRREQHKEAASAMPIAFLIDCFVNLAAMVDVKKKQRILCSEV
ncbi:hypothetical protein NE237_028562 [Protea cynaroides]|uniref:Uncharacterized protein n=1 Tax=Protea cynaroides TaxID=273540 RepID=A0A9Q0GSM7_9MAGN|nr:hypothetical protein NE237_028562 [Protea cynaroides]